MNIYVAGKMYDQQVLSKVQIWRMKKEFLGIDQDGDGKISTDELGQVLRNMQKKLRASEDEIQAAIESIDLDGNGMVNLAEYYVNQKGKSHHDLVHRALIQRSRIRKEFQRFDMDKSGFITEEELLAVIHARGAKFSAHQVNMTLKETDKNDDGKIDYEEFVMLMTK